MDFYTRNLSVLKSKYPLLAQKIEKTEKLSSVEVIQSKVGVPTLRIRNNGDKGILLHSAYNPLKEAKNLVSGYNLKETQFLIVLGFGLGYHIREILKNYPWIKLIIIVELNIPLFKTSLKLLDLSPIFISPKIRLILEGNPLDIRRQLKFLGEMFLTGKNSIIVHNPSFSLYKEKFTEIKKSIKDAILWSRSNLTTNIVKGNIFQKNILSNLPQIIKSPGVKNLFGKFENKPVICVAAGPSLDKNVHLLKQAKNKALIICMDASLKVMLHYGIKPDIVVSIDYGAGTRNLFEGLMDQTKDLFLAADPEDYPGILSDFKGKKFIINIHKPLTQWLAKFMEDKGFLDKGASVAHAAFSLAKAVGGNPIILIGQDLSYPGGITHSQGATPRTKVLTGIDKNTGKRYLLSQDKNGKWIGRNLIMVEDIYGKEVSTDEAMYSYLIHLEEMISSTKATCIDATEGGAKIRGTEIMSLREVIDNYCTEFIGVGEILDKAANKREKVRLDELKEEMKKTIIKLKEMNFWAKEGQKIIKKLYQEVKKGNLHSQETKRLMIESNSFKDKIVKIEPFIRAFLEQEMYSYLYLMKRKTNLRIDQLSTKKKLITQIEKVGIFYEGVREASEKLKGDFQTTLEELKKKIECLEA